MMGLADRQTDGPPNRYIDSPPHTAVSNTVVWTETLGQMPYLRDTWRFTVGLLGYCCKITAPATLLSGANQMCTECYHFSSQMRLCIVGSMSHSSLLCFHHYHINVIIDCKFICSYFSFSIPNFVHLNCCYCCHCYKPALFLLCYYKYGSSVHFKCHYCNICCIKCVLNAIISQVDCCSKRCRLATCVKEFVVDFRPLLDRAVSAPQTANIHVTNNE